MEKMVDLANFWQGKRVLVTGHTGFKGSWLCEALLGMGAEVSGLALSPSSQPALFNALALDDRMTSKIVDIRNPSAVRETVAAVRPQIVFHLAAQALVRLGYADPVATFATNVMGTTHVLEAMREAPDLHTAVIVTTDKVYRNNEWSYPYRESDPLGGYDPYSASKACTELVTSCYYQSFLKEQGVRLATARAGNVIGGGDWSVDRLIPDAVRAWSTGDRLVIRRPAAVRPWQHVLEPVAAYLKLARALADGKPVDDTYNFGPDTNGSATVNAVINRARQAFGRGDTHFEQHETGPHEAGLLGLETARARDSLDVCPRWTLDVAIDRTMQWYRNNLDGQSARDLCAVDISTFRQAA